MPDTKPIGASQVIKYAAEALTILAIGNYAIGFTIVNSYLLTFGYSGNAQGGLRNMQTLLAETQLLDSTEKELLLLLKSTYDDKGLLRGGSGWLDSLFSFLSGASRVADYAAGSRAGRLS